MTIALSRHSANDVRAEKLYQYNGPKEVGEPCMKVVDIFEIDMYSLCKILGGSYWMGYSFQYHLP